MSAARLLHNTHGAEYMPLNLKGVLQRYGLAQNDWADAVIQATGVPLSLSAATQILNWNTWPKKTPPGSIKKQTEDWLLARGVLTGDLVDLWAMDADDRYRLGHPAGAHIGQGMKPTATPDIDPIGETEMLTPAAKKAFQLFRDPFQDDVQGAEDVFLAADQRYIREAMFTTSKHGGFLAVVGESGAGKSVLRRDLIDRIGREGAPISVIQPRMIDKRSLNASAIFEAIIDDLLPGAKLRRTMEGKSRQAENLLRDSSRAGNSHVLLIEEAHDLTIQTLKVLKRFWEIEDGFKRLLAIILVGQPELKMKLDERHNFEAREVIRRCEIAELMPLDGHLEDYLALKFKRIGKTPEEILGADALDAMRQRLMRRNGQSVVSMLYPLVVNNLVTKAMNHAAELGVPLVTGDVIRAI